MPEPLCKRADSQVNFHKAKIPWTQYMLSQYSKDRTKQWGGPVPKLEYANDIHLGEFRKNVQLLKLSLPISNDLLGSML